MTRFSSFLILFALTVSLSGEELPPPGLRRLDQPDPARDARLAWYKDARFGCFVHWGVYSSLGNEFEGRKGGTYAEHIMRVLKIPRAVYLEKVAKPFNPRKFDADAWVKLMHDAGMRYLVITAKHHDGFAMYPSKVTSYNIVDTSAFHRDPMRELQAACKKYGLKFGFYYSHAWDWENPDAIGNGWDYGPPGGESGWWEKRPDLEAKAARYVNGKAIPQIKELYDLYHPDIFWFDTSSKTTPALNRHILEAVRAYAPDVVINSRLVTNYGDYRSTADRPAYFPDTPGNWEGIPTTNESYGYNKFDHSQKPPGHFIRLLAEAVSKGGNILMNIGPRGDGTIDPADQAILQGIGSWMGKYSESIYGCDRTPLPVQNWGTSTRKGSRLYLHVFHWPADGKLSITGLRSDPRLVRILGSGPGETPATARRLDADDLEIIVPAKSPDAVDSVVVVDFAGEIMANRARLLAAKNEPTVLHVFDGHLEGTGIRYGDAKRTRDVIEEWSGAGATVSWPIRLVKPATFKIEVNYNTLTAGNTGTYKIVAGGQALTGATTPTRDVSTFRIDEPGSISLPAGEFTLTVSPVKIAGGNLMRLRELTLTPAN